MSRPATARRPVAPRHPRRVSGPVARPRPRPVPAPAPQRSGAIQSVTDHRFLDSLLRSRAWIWIVAVSLGGIVAMQVSLLKLNTGISRAVESAATLERQNAELEVQVARLSSDERIRAAAADLGLVMPDAGAVEFLQARPERDAARAVNRMQPPSSEARQLIAAGGRVPAGTLTAAPGTVAEPVATPQPVATAVPAPTPAPTAAPTAQPVGTTAGGQPAPQG